MGRRASLPTTEDPLVTEKKTAVMALTDDFCDRHLNAEYKKLTRKLIEQMAKEVPSPLLRSRAENLAAGIVHAIGAANFLFDKSFKPYVSAAEIAAHFGVSPATASQKAGALRDKYPLDFPSTDFATKRMKEMVGTLLDTLGASGLSIGGDNIAIQMTSPDGSTMFADQFRTPSRSRKPKGEFIDDDRPAMSAFYDLIELAERDDKIPQVLRGLEKLINQDPDFYDSYLMLADYVEDQDEGLANNLRETAFQRALARITDKNGNWPKVLEWGWLENRHVIRALDQGATMRWEAGQTDAALDIYRKLLASNPGDNIGARNYILAIRLGETLEEHEARFATRDGYLDARKMYEWFDSNYLKFPEEFAEWKKAVDKMMAE